jgi:hypothetical protein
MHGGSGGSAFHEILMVHGGPVLKLSQARKCRMDGGRYSAACRLERDVVGLLGGAEDLLAPGHGYRGVFLRGRRGPKKNGETQAPPPISSFIDVLRGVDYFSTIMRVRISRCSAWQKCVQ